MVLEKLPETLAQAMPALVEPAAVAVARGEVELGFQQLSELMHLDGVDVIGTLPEAIISQTKLWSKVNCSSNFLRSR